MKAWDIVAYGFDGALYCTDCVTDQIEIDGDPMFATEDEYGTCAECLQPIEETI